jgi:thiol-disulfide isomerase/thioredoxin
MLAVSLLTACGGNEGGAGNTDSTTPTVQTTGADAAHTVVVKNENGLALEGIRVAVYADSEKTELMTFANTNAEGKVSFTAALGGTYYVSLDKVPSGYTVSDVYTVTAVNTEISLATEISDNTDLTGVKYEKGSVIRDYKVVTPEGETLSFKNLLGEKKALVINFWYTNCDPCKREFPHVEAAYKKFKDSIALVALSPKECGDTNKDIAAFKQSNGLSFTMAGCGNDLKDAFGITGYPTTVIVDRYGVICVIKYGEINSSAAFEAALAYYTADDYVQKQANDFDEFLKKPDTTVPDTTVPDTTVPETTVPETTVPDTTVPETTVPETTAPVTTPPTTTAPVTTPPTTTAPETEAPPVVVKKDYSVSVLDAFGKAQSGVTVKFNGAENATATTNSSGKATAKLTAGDYTVEVVLAAGLDYARHGVTLSASETSATVIVGALMGSTYEDIYGEFRAYNIGVGGTYVTLNKADVDAGGRTYFLFTPTASGKYAVTCAVSGVTIGQYGSSIHFIQSVDISEEKISNGFTINVAEANIGGTYVIGVDVADAAISECVIGIKREGNADGSPDDIEWTEYKGTHTPTKYTLPAGASLISVDITMPTGTYNLVLNEDDGFYHIGSKNGPVALVNLGVNAPHVSIATALETANLCKYFYDSKGNLIKRESYNACLEQYVAAADANSGVYPLTEDLRYMITQTGEHKGWWDASSVGYLFGDVIGVNNDIAWMFLLCYYA